MKDDLANCVEEEKGPKRIGRLCEANLQGVRDNPSSCAKEKVVVDAVDMSVVGLVEDSSGKAEAAKPSGEKVEENAAEPSEARAEEKTPKVSGVKV